MTNRPESESFGFATQQQAQVPWWWQHHDAAGNVLEPDAGRQEFPTRSDAESWLGEAWADLAEAGVAAVTLHEGDRPVYGPMPLSA